MQITEIEKNIYNCYLKHFRNGEPFQPRKDFDNLSLDVLTNIKKLSNFFKKYPNIKWDEFFGSPKKLNPEEKCPNLNFFTSRAAIKSYNLYKKHQEMINPENQLEDIKNSFHFIGMFCLKNKINLDNYIHHQTGALYSWVYHYKEQKINLYSILELGDISSQLTNLPDDEKELYGDDLFTKISKFKIKYYNSDQTKKYVKLLKDKIENFLKNHLQK
jgi:hypothetical protein